jgi:hypothetical protein
LDLDPHGRGQGLTGPVGSWTADDIGEHPMGHTSHIGPRDRAAPLWAFVIN